MEHFDNSITPGAGKLHNAISILLTAFTFASYTLNDLLCTVSAILTIAFTVDRWRHHRKTRNKN